MMELSESDLLKAVDEFVAKNKRMPNFACGKFGLFAHATSFASYTQDQEGGKIVTVFGDIRFQLDQDADTLYLK